MNSMKKLVGKAYTNISFCLTHDYLNDRTPLGAL